MRNTAPFPNDITRLRQEAIEAIAEGDFPWAQERVEAIRQLDAWQAQGQPGSPPVDIAKLISGELALRIWSDQELESTMRRVWKKVEEQRYDQALARLTLVEKLAQAESLRQEARASVGRVQQARQKKLDEVLVQARRLGREQPENLAAQRDAWEMALAFQLDHAEVAAALKRLDDEERRVGLRQQIERLQEPLRAIRKDFGRITEIYALAGDMLEGDTVPDADLRGQIEDIRAQLERQRDEIVRAARGGASNARAGQWEEAIQVYSAALRAGFDVIPDDVTGEPLAVLAALQEAQQIYWDTLSRQAEALYSKAATVQQEGLPETAIPQLEEAQSLTNRIGRDNGELRRRLDDALVHARAEQRLKQDAERLVAAAEQDPNLEHGRALLRQAQQTYANYPGLDRLVQAKEGQLLEHVVLQMSNDIADAREAAAKAATTDSLEDARSAFEWARSHCRTALNRGANLSHTNEEREAKCAEAEQVLQEIAALESAHYVLLDRLRTVDEALAARDVGVAESLLAGLNVAERQNPCAQRRQEALQQFLNSEGL